ncbi:MAG: thiamine pyrophosphate-dependent dehydrogenase E1 component subunit alpha [Caulobacterales bacterium]
MSSLYEDMLRIRLVEQRLSALFADNKVPGFIHSSLGQEAASVGIIRALEPQDTLASNHRGHGHALTKGIPLTAFFAEVMGREAGSCGGRGGSMHVADAGVGMLGANGIVGAGLSIALGSALAHQVQKTGGIAVVFFGDGALCEGLLHECLNMAQLWRLPMVFACENNGWSEFTPTAREFTSDICTLAGAFGIEGRSVDGNDVLAVLDAALSLTAIAREGRPVVLEARTARVGGHFEGDQQRYRETADIEDAKSRDPIVRFEKVLAGSGIHDAALDKIRVKVSEEIERAVAKAMQSPEPRFEDALAGVYSRASAA